MPIESGGLPQAPAPAHIIDKGIPTTGLLAQVLVAKYADHLPLYRQEGIFARAGLALPRSTLAQWAGVCGVQLQPHANALQHVILAHPGKQQTHRAYIWAYSTTAFADTRAVAYHFTLSRAGEHARDIFCDWSGKLVCDDYADNKASFGQGITEIGCMAHARR